MNEGSGGSVVKEGRKGPILASPRTYFLEGPPRPPRNLVVVDVVVHPVPRMRGDGRKDDEKMKEDERRKDER
jgi:hypothetical protein